MVLHKRKVRTLLALIGFLLLARPANGQNEPDTLDWRMYFPLEVGNTWEYLTVEGPPIWRLEVVGDTIAAAQRYFIIDELNGTSEIDRWYVRYDSAGAIVFLSALDADTLRSPYVDQFVGYGFLGNFNLQANFGDTLSVVSDSGDTTTYWVAGTYSDTVQVGDGSYPTIATKRFHTSYWEECYAAGIGFIGGGSLQQSWLAYARIDGTEYGVSYFTSVETNSFLNERVLIESIFPNPVVKDANVVFIVAQSGPVTIELFNVLGQRILSEHKASLLVGKHHYVINRRNLASGSYYLRIGTSNGGASIRPFIIAQ